MTASGPGGTAAASYEIRANEQAQAHVRVNVWSRGAWVQEGRTYARVAVEVLNSGEQPISLDTSALRLEAYANNGAQLPEGQLVRTSSPDGSLYVAAGETGMIELDYVMMANVGPDDIGNLRLRWAIAHDDGRRYVQFTDFRRVREQYATTGYVYYDPIWGYYDPFLYGPPYRYHLTYRVPVGRVIIDHHHHRPHTVRR